MKKLILAITLFLSLNSFGQEMKYANGKIFFNDVQITPQIAKEKSQFVSSEDAYMYFRSASRIRGWNYFWAIFGGYELGAGSVALAYGSTFAILDVGLGGVCLGIIPTRESRRRLLMKKGVEAYNEAVSKEKATIQ